MDKVHRLMKIALPQGFTAKITKGSVACRGIPVPFLRKCIIRIQIKCIRRRINFRRQRFPMDYRKLRVFQTLLDTVPYDKVCIHHHTGSRNAGQSIQLAGSPEGGRIYGVRNCIKFRGNTVIPDRSEAKRTIKPFSDAVRNHTNAAIFLPPHQGRQDGGHQLEICYLIWLTGMVHGIGTGPV